MGTGGEATVGQFGSRTEAQMARHLLEGAGIAARVRADDAAALHPELGQTGMFGGITLMVAVEDVADARALLDSLVDDSLVDRDGSRREHGDTDEAPGASPRSRTGILLLIVLVVLPLGLVFTVLDLLTRG